MLYRLEQKQPAIPPSSERVQLATSLRSAWHGQRADLMSRQALLTLYYGFTSTYRAANYL